jgi:hypothetical protein
MKKCNLLCISILAIVNVVFILLLLPKTNKFESQFTIYPTSLMDGLKFVSILEGAHFDGKIKEELRSKNFDSRNFEIKAQAKKNELINVKIISRDENSLPLLSQNIQDFIVRYFKENQLRSTNSEIHVFILNDIISLYKPELATYTENEKNYMSTLGFKGLLLENIIKLRASLYVDSRIFNIDIATIIKEIETLKTSVEINIDSESNLTPMPMASKSLFNFLEPYYQVKNDCAKSTDETPSARSINYNFIKATIQIAEERKKVITTNMDQNFGIKMLPDPNTKASYNLKDIVLNLLLINICGLILITFINKFEIRVRPK